LKTLFKTNIDCDCSNKKYTIESELCYWDEKELLQKNVDELIEEWFETYKYKDLPIIDFDNAFLGEEPTVGRTHTYLNIYIPLIGSYDSLCYQPYSQYLLCSNYEAEIDNENNRLLMSLSLPNKPDMDIDSLIETVILKIKKNIVLQYDYLKKDIELYNNSIKGHLKRKFEEAINQLLSYISSDIFYSSLIIFNKKNKSVIEDSIQTIKTHPSFIEQITTDRFKFKHPTRDNCNLEISLISFDVFYKE